MNTPAYQAISKHYGHRRAQRSEQLLMQHIDEGVSILRKLGANTATLDAWCLHPLVQDDEQLRKTLDSGLLTNQDPQAVALALLYRETANAHLSHHPPKAPKPGALQEVRWMLVADKVQNRNDFEAYLIGRQDVPNTDRLVAYFAEWFDALGISDADYQRLQSGL